MATLLYNGVSFAPVCARMSIVLPFPAVQVWQTVGNFGRQALWMGTVQGHHIYTELLGGEDADYIGAVRVFGIADKMIFEQLTRLDSDKMVMAWQCITHPMNSNPFPASFLNFKASIKLAPVLVPGDQTFVDWRMELLTEEHAVLLMCSSMEDIMKIGLLNLYKYLQSPRPVPDKSIAAPSSFGINNMAQPVSAPPPMYHSVPTSDEGPNSLLVSNPTFVPPPQHHAPMSPAPQQAFQHAAAPSSLRHSGGPGLAAHSLALNLSQV